MSKLLSPDDFMVGILAEPVDLDVPPLGTVRVRGLTVAEVVSIGKAAKGDSTQLLINSVATGMVTPAMSPDQLMSAPAGMVRIYRQIAERIAELSGISEDVEKLESFLGGGS